MADAPASAYMLIYDVVSQPDRIQPPWGVYAVLCLVAVCLLIAGIASVRKWEGRSAIFCVLSVLFCVGCVGGIYRETLTYRNARQAVERQDYTTLEGCLDQFHAGKAVGGKQSSTHEIWWVSGTRFEYSSGQTGPGFHQTSGGYGWLDNRSRVRVAYIDVDGSHDRQIVRLEAQRNACPPAPDISF